MLTKGGGGSAIDNFVSWGEGGVRDLLKYVN